MHSDIYVAIVEDEPLVTSGLIGLFSTVAHIQVSLCVPSVEAFLEQSSDKHVDVLLLDIGLKGGMTGIKGIPLIRQRHPDTDIIMLTTFEESEKIFQALCAGATAYLTKRTPFEVIVEAIEQVHAGGSYMSPGIARKVVEYFNPKKNRGDVLTPRQQQIVEGIVEGLSYKMISAKLMVGIETVRDHIKHIYRKLEINSKAELIRMKMNGELD